MDPRPAPALLLAGRGPVEAVVVVDRPPDRHVERLPGGRAGQAQGPGRRRPLHGDRARRIDLAVLVARLELDHPVGAAQGPGDLVRDRLPGHRQRDQAGRVELDPAVRDGRGGGLAAGPGFPQHAVGHLARLAGRERHGELEGQVIVGPALDALGRLAVGQVIEARVDVVDHRAARHQRWPPVIEADRLGAAARIAARSAARGRRPARRGAARLHFMGAQIADLDRAPERAAARQGAQLAVLLGQVEVVGDAQRHQRHRAGPVALDPEAAERLGKAPGDDLGAAAQPDVLDDRAERNRIIGDQFALEVGQRVAEVGDLQGVEHHVSAVDVARHVAGAAQGFQRRVRSLRRGALVEPEYREDRTHARLGHGGEAVGVGRDGELAGLRIIEDQLGVGPQAAEAG